MNDVIEIVLVLKLSPRRFYFCSTVLRVLGSTSKYFVLSTQQPSSTPCSHSESYVFNYFEVLLRGTLLCFIVL
jgi:hypothetical protein